MSVHLCRGGKGGPEGYSPQCRLDAVGIDPSLALALTQNSPLGSPQDIIIAMLTPLNNWLLEKGLSLDIIAGLDDIIALTVLVLLAFAVKVSSNRLWHSFIHRAIIHSRNKWDDILAEKHFFQRILLLLPLLTCTLATDFLFASSPTLLLWLRRIFMALLVIVLVRAFAAATSAIDLIYGRTKMARTRPIRGYLTALRISSYIVAGIIIIAILANKSPWGIISVFGGLTAVLLLIFKDSILGFVANLQLTSSDMVRVGDWIEVPKFNADGDVIDINLHTVLVQNWDKTISSIPAYALISDGFKNWRGMTESGGRRIKRAIYLDMNSIHFCSPELLDNLNEITLLKKYLASKTTEIAKDNQQRQNTSHVPANRRQQTNIGIFRAYVEAYLTSHKQINKELTFLVRQLPPTPQGLPLEIYVFCKDKVWANYEAIQADIFDHLLAIIPEFELKVFQYPSGQDLHFGP